MNRNAFSTPAERIAWLVKHPELLELSKDLTRRVNKKKIVAAMKHDGLVSIKTYWPDVQINEEIKAARLECYRRKYR